MSAGEQAAAQINAIPDVAGSLAHYGKGRKRVPFRAARKKAWEAVVREKRKRR